MTFKNYKSLKIGDWNFKKLIRASDGLVLFEKKPSLPYNRRVSCLRSTGTQYIDTGIVLTGSHEIYLRVYIEKSDSYGALIYFGTNSPRCWITSGIIRYSDNNTGAANNFRRFNAYNEFILNEKTVTINDKSQDLALGTFGTPGTKTAYLFRANGTDIGISDNLRISDWSVKKDGVLIQKLIPVIDLSGRPAMYDEITGQMFYNQGTGEFDWDEIVENPYVTDGLVAMWDAEWNCVLGLHSMDTTKWNDIVSGYNLELASGTPTWEAKANVINGKWGIVSPELQALFKAANNNNLSYEVCFSALPNISGTVLGFNGNTIGIITYTNTIGDWCWSRNWISSTKLGNTRKGTLSVVRNGQTGRTDVYADGETFGGKTGSVDDPTGRTFGIGYGYGQWNKATTGIKIHCIRLYNRMLTADEIQKNKDIDANRFLI